MIDAVVEDAKSSKRATSGKVDVFFASTGTGGTLTGVARGLKKEHNPAAKVVAIDVVSRIVSVYMPADNSIWIASIERISSRSPARAQ